MTNTARTAIGLAVIALLATLAAGQRGPGDRRIQQGNALDANPGLGSSGYNSGNKGAGQTINSQLYVSGRTSGLTGFRGSVPYYPPGGLQVGLPGAGVRSFEQQSVGLREATSGYAHRTSGYYDRRQTVLGLGGLPSGLASPGSNVPQYSTLSPQVANQLHSAASRRYQTLITQPDGGPLLWQNPLQSPIDASIDGSFPDDRSAGASFRPGAASAFSLPWRDDRQKLLAELNAVRRDRGATALLSPDADQPDEDDPRIGTLITGQPGAADAPPAPPLRGPSLMPEPGQDAFHDLLMAIAEEEAAAAADQTGAPPPADDGAEGALVLPRQSGMLVISSLAGKNPDMFNRFMTEAQTLMNSGRFYDAAARFGAAAAANSQNPLAPMGAALAMFGAGEPVSAAFRLRHAMAIFPPVMETRMAVGGMIDAGVFDRRLAELDDLLGEQTPSDSQMLLLLATYMHASAGQEDQAKACAQRLADVANDAIAAAYAQFVLTGQRPDEQSAQPAN